MTSAQKRAFVTKQLAQPTTRISVVRPIDILRSLPAKTPMSGIEKAEIRADRMERRSK